MRYRFRDLIPVWTLIAVNTVVFIITTASPSTRDFLALTNPVNGNKYWTILSAIFVHANFFHILFNMLTLYFFGAFCLQLIGVWRFLAVYFVGGIVGNILFLLIGPTFSEVLGASGAIFAVGGVLVVMRPNLRVYLYFVLPLPLWVVIIFGFLLTAFNSGTAWQAHLGGLVVGAIAGWIFRMKKRQRLPAVYYRW
jgi:membrane associated rhomboid family serine protease